MKHRKVLALLLVFSAVFAGAQALCIHADHRFVDLRTRVENDCTAYRSKYPDAQVCRDDPHLPSAIRELTPARAHIARATEAAERGDRATVEAELVAAMDIAVRLERRKTLIAELVAGRIVKDAVDLIEQKNVDGESRRAVLAHAPAALGLNPMEAMRVDRNQRVVSNAEHDWFFGTGLGESLLRGETKENDHVYGGMRTALERGDVAACEAAARGRSGPLAPWTSSGLDPIMCAKYMDLRATAARLTRLRLRS